MAGLYLFTLLSLSQLVYLVGAAPCSPGSFGPENGQQPCIPCPPGTWQDQSGASTCKEAQPGYYSGQGATSQAECQPGYYSTGLASSCTICPPGTHCNGQGNTQPQQCEPGRFSASPGASQDCSECPTGTFSNTRGAKSCCKCCSGFYTDQVGQTHCFQCPNEGSFQQGYSPPGATSSSQCVAAPGALTSCVQEGNVCPSTSIGTSGVVKRRNYPLPTAARCPSGHSSCPIYAIVYGSQYVKKYECVDTQYSLESCGGCVDHDSPDGQRNFDGGRDCSAIPNVDDVRCVRGDCVILKCSAGFKLSANGSRCIHTFVY